MKKLSQIKKDSNKIFRLYLDYTLGFLRAKHQSGRGDNYTHDDYRKEYGVLK